MAKRWVRDEFTGDGDVLYREATTGQTWGVPEGASIRPTGVVTNSGVATFNASTPGGYNTDIRCVLIEPFRLETDENIYEWTLPRFPDVAWSSPSFYKPAEVLLCFESIGISDSGGLGKIQAIRVGFDPASDQMFVTEPTRSRDDYGTMYDGSVGFPAPTFHYPLPDLDDGLHPSEYVIKLRTTVSGCTLWINDDLVFEDVARVSTADFGSEPKIRCGVGFVLGNTGLPGANTEPYMSGTWDFNGVMEVTEFRFNYAPLPFETGVPLNQMARKDGLNASGEYQLNQQGVGRPGGPIWQLSGQ